MPSVSLTNKVVASRRGVLAKTSWVTVVLFSGMSLVAQVGLSPVGGVALLPQPPVTAASLTLLSYINHLRNCISL